METMVDHIQAWKRKDLDAACRIWKAGLEELHAYIYADYSRLHVRYKIATWLRGLIPLPHMRPPMPKPKKEEVAALRKLLSNAGFDLISVKDSNRIVR